MSQNLSQKSSQKNIPKNIGIHMSSKSKKMVNQPEKIERNPATNNSRPEGIGVDK